MFSGRSFDTPYLHRWRKAAAAVGVPIAVAIATIFYSAIALVVLLGLLVIFAASAIASGGKLRPAAPSSRAEIDRAWAERVIACPLWVETAATSIEWTSLGGAVALVVWNESLLFPHALDRVALVFLTLMPVVVTAALALAVWERRTARRTLRSRAL